MDVGLICRTQTTDSDRSLPLKLFEYMACQKPVISVPLAGVREAVGDRVLYASDSAQLAESIERLFADRDLRQSLGTQGRSLVERDYAWESICERFDDLLVQGQHE